MKFKPYEKVPLYIATEGHVGEYIFADSASFSVSQDINVSRQLDDNILQICAFGDGSNLSFNETMVFTPGTPTLCVLGPIGGPPKPLATSIFSIPKDTKITFPNQKFLYTFSEIKPHGQNYLIQLYSQNSNVTLTPYEAQNGYFEPNFNYVSSSPIKGSLDVDFYIGENNLQHFFNITGLSDPSVYPPINNETASGFLGDFKFSSAYLTQFSFSIGANSMIQAQASFDVYGNLIEDPTLSANYYSSSLYQQQSVPHADRSKIIGLSSIGMNDAVSFSYNATISRYPRYEAPTENFIPEVGFLPERVSKRETSVSISVEGDNLDPSILQKAARNENIQITCELHDLSYESADNNTAGLLSSFNCNGAVSQQNLSVTSLGYLNGSVTINQNLQ